MTARSLPLIGLVALIGTALSAMGSLPPGLGGTTPATGAKAGFRCELVVSPQGTGTAVEARVSATRSVSGRYELSMRTGSNVVAQDGAFEAAAGQTITLGEATLPGAPSALDATLAVTTGGQRVECPSVSR